MELATFKYEFVEPNETDVYRQGRKQGRPAGSVNGSETSKAQPKIVNNRITGPIDNSWTASAMKAARVKSSTDFLIDNPDFEEMPATLREFLGPEYLDIDRSLNPDLPKGVGVREGVKEALIEIFGDSIDTEEISEKRRAMFTGAIGVGKTTLASIALAYMVHWVECLYDPQAYFGLLAGSRIAFMLMSTKDTQAKEVLFGDIKARVNGSKWFQSANVHYDPRTKNQLLFPKDICVIPGNSAETTFEGYNVLGGVLDEGDSHKVTDNKDYAEAGYNTIHSRIDSRFPNPQTQDHRGLLIVIGQMKKADGFMARKKKELEEDERASVTTMTIWDSFGWNTYRKRNGKPEFFYYDILRRVVVPNGPALAVHSENHIKVPETYRKAFENDPVKALRDLAGIPPAVEDPFIAATDRIYEAQAAWKERHKHLYSYVVSSSPTRPEFHEEFYCRDAFKRALHIDIGYAATGDAMGMAMGHIPEIVEIDGELKPIIVIDFMLRIRASGGNQLRLADFRKIIFYLRDELGFKISIVTYDGFQSVDSLQILREKKFNAVELSLDRKKGPYEDLREALYERRIELPKYVTYKKRGDVDKIDIAYKELSELTDTGLKIGRTKMASSAIQINPTLHRGRRLFQITCEVCGHVIIRRNAPGRYLPYWMHLHIIANLLAWQSTGENPVAKHFHDIIVCTSCHKRLDETSKKLGFNCDHEH